ncbi:MAG: DUF342 domain-containing protein [Nitrosomonadales bacterium]|nr:DUF342 domain-containing protein [Nitrosomonadales bacterium]
MKYLSIHLDEKAQKVVASFTPEGDINTVTPDDFMQAIHAAGLGGYNIHHPTLKEAAAKYNSGNAFEIIVGDALDGKFSIRIDIDSMAAYLNCTLPLGGVPVTLPGVLQEAERRGITVALDLPAIEKALIEGGDNIRIACGRPPVAGIDGRLESLVPKMKERKPRLDEHGLADFRELGDIVTVHAGDALIRRIPPTNGEPGETVTGKIIPVKAGKNIVFAAKLAGAIVDPKDPDTLIAAISGCPVILKNGVSVEPVYTVKDVDLHTGNISYDGTVHVSGDVHADMTIKATGDIYVDGTVDNAMLEAGGDITIKGGIIGASELHDRTDRKFHAAIKSGGSCTARFAQNAHLSAGSGIFIHDVAMLSELKAGHQIVVGDKDSRKGDIIGGSANATMLVSAQNIGSSANVKTLIVAGADRLLYGRLKLSVKSREAAEHKLLDIIKLLDLAHSNPDRISHESIETAEATRDALNAEIETLREIEAELSKEIDLAKGAQVIVKKRVYSGAEVHMNLEHYLTTEDREGGVFHLDAEGNLVLT